MVLTREILNSANYRYNFRVEKYQNSKYRNDSPYFKGANLWDNLPVDVTRAPTLGEFKAKIRRISRHLVDGCFRII